MRNGKLPMALLRSCAVAACMVVGTAGMAQVVNPGFDTPNAALAPPNYLASRTTVGQTNSSALAWTLYNAAAGSTTTTQLLPTTDPFGGTAPYMIDVMAGSAGSSIVQYLPVATSLPSISYDVNIIRGTVRLVALTTGGLFLGQTVSSVTGWQTLTLAPTSQPVGRIGLAAVGGPADYQVDLRGIPTAPVPEPGVLAMLGALVPASGLAFWRRRKR